MCHAVPVKLIEKNSTEGLGERDGLKIEIDLSLVPEAEVGQWLVVHVGIALSVLENEDGTL